MSRRDKKYREERYGKDGKDRYEEFREGKSDKDRLRKGRDQYEEHEKREKHYEKRRDRRSSEPPGEPRRRLSLSLEAVEIARGSDGPLRGEPEVTLIFAVFGVKTDQISLLDRVHRRIPVNRPYPATTEIRDKRDRRTLEVSIHDAWSRLLILGLAVEQDNGKDIEAIYAALAEPNGLVGWSIHELMPEPLTLVEAGLGALSTPPAATLVHLMRDSVPIEETCTSDDWVGAAVVVLDPEARQQERWRLHFASKNSENDWTALVALRV